MHDSVVFVSPKLRLVNYNTTFLFAKLKQEVKTYFELVQSKKINTEETRGGRLGTFLHSKLQRQNLLLLLSPNSTLLTLQTQYYNLHYKPRHHSTCVPVKSSPSAQAGQLAK